MAEVLDWNQLLCELGKLISLSRPQVLFCEWRGRKGSVRSLKTPWIHSLRQRLQIDAYGPRQVI